jgi:glycosyltransferase involved in cell wall biosynthesis
LIIGDGVQKSNLLCLIKSLHIENDIKFLGFVSNPWTYMRNSDMLVCSSKSESFSCVIVEAMACNCPVVSTDCVGPSEILEHGKWGRIVPVGNIEALSAAIFDTLESPIQSEYLVNRAMDFSTEKSLDQYISLIEN